MQFLESSSRPTGTLHIEVFRDGVLSEIFHEDNLVVDGYKNTHAHLVGGDTTNFRVTQFAVGTSGAAPLAANTALTGVFAKAVSSVSYPSSGQVQFGFSLLSGEANGMAIMEFGLLTVAGVLYARRVRASALNKTALISLSGTWTINF